MIAEFSLRRLHNGEHITFIDRVLHFVPAQGLPASVLATRDQLEAFHNAIKAAHVGADESALSQRLRELDGTRDDLFSGLSLLAAAYRSNPVAEKAAAGRLVARRMAGYGSVKDVTMQGDADESADINSLLRDLRGTDLVAATTLIGATEWIDGLARAQARFEEIYLQRNAERSDRRAAKPDNIEALRPKAAEAFRSLCRKINSFSDTDEGAGPWPGIINSLTTLIGETRSLLAARRGRAEAAAAPAPSA